MTPAVHVRRCYHCREPYRPRGPAKLCLDCEGTKAERQAQARTETYARREAARRRSCACGAPIHRTSTHCRICAQSPEHGAPIDPHTRYDDDARCQYVVAAHPDGINNDQIGQLLGISRERVRQILDLAIERLRRRCAMAGITEDDVRDMLARRAAE